MSKKHLREIAIEKRAGVNLPDAGEKIVANFFAHIQIPQNSVIASYVPFRSEIDVRVLNAKCEAAGHELCLPRIDFAQQKMVFCAYKIGDELADNKFGIPEPLTGAEEVEPNVVLVPMLGFDRAKSRLGYGGGYYDKYLENKDVLKVGVAYSAQEIAGIPAQAHDIKMDKILTEDFVL